MPNDIHTTTTGRTVGSWEVWDGTGWIDLDADTPVVRTTFDGDVMYEVQMTPDMVVDAEDVGEWFECRPGATGRFERAER